MENIKEINETNLEEKEKQIKEKLSGNMINLRSFIYALLFKNKKLKRPVDNLMIGFFIGYFSSRTKEEIKESEIEELINIYIDSCKKNKDLETHLSQLTTDYVNYFNKGKYIDINSLFQYDEKLLDEYLKKEKEVHMEEKLQKCKICNSDFNLLDEYNYSFDCNCIIHGDCFDSLVIKCIEQKTLPIKCPECGKEIRDIYIYQSLKSIDREDLLDQYENFYFDKLPNKNELITCPTIGCRYRIFLDKNVIEFNCPVCLNNYCMKCHSKWHKGISCEEFMKNYYNSFSYINNIYWYKDYNLNRFYKQCPFCNHWNLININEKNYIVCSRCAHEFCVKCGKVFYGGRGTNVCKCKGVNKDYIPPNNKKLTKRQRIKLRKLYGY